MTTLRYNEISMKASHNSYQRDERLVEQITWNIENHYNCGCGGIELDIAQSKDGKDWSVGHTTSYHTTYRQLSKFLSELSVCAATSPEHDVITLHLDLKSVRNDHFPEELDGYVRAHLRSSIFGPKDFFNLAEKSDSGKNLSALVNEKGWPLLDDLKRHFIICVTGNKTYKEKYATTDPDKRLCFADKDTKDDEIPNDPYRVFFNFHIYQSKREKWMETFRACKDKKNVIIRAYEANSEDNWNDCLKSGCNIIATNKVSDHKWAKVGASRFVKRTFA